MAVDLISVGEAKIADHVRNLTTSFLLEFGEAIYPNLTLFTAHPTFCSQAIEKNLRCKGSLSYHGRRIPHTYN